MEGSVRAIELNPEAAITGLFMQICARAATGIADLVMQWRPGKKVVQCSGWTEDFPSLGAPLLSSDLGFVGGEWRLTVNLILRAAGLHLIYSAV